MSVSVHPGYPNLAYSPESTVPAKAKRLALIALVAGLGVALLVAVVRPFDAQALASAQEAPLLQGD